MQCDKETYSSSTSDIQLVDCCDAQVFPLLHTLLKMLITLPSSGATAERSFFTLKRIKTYWSSTTTEERLNGLSLLNIHHDINVSVDQVIDRYAKTRKHRLDFVL